MDFSPPRPSTAAGPAGGIPFTPRPSNGHHTTDAHREREVLTTLFRSAKRVARLQLKIWFTQTKIALLRIAILGVAFTLAAILAILGLIFFYVGCYHILTDVFHFKTAWACLIFAGAHVVIIGILIGTALLIVRRRRKFK